jgi:hypothetical protein
MVPVDPIITGVTCVFTFHMSRILLYGFYILESSRPLSLSRFCLPGLLHQLAYYYYYCYYYLRLSQAMADVFNYPYYGSI